MKKFPLGRNEKDLVFITTLLTGLFVTTNIVNHCSY